MYVVGVAQSSLSNACAPFFLPDILAVTVANTYFTSSSQSSPSSVVANGLIGKSISELTYFVLNGA